MTFKSELSNICPDSDNISQSLIFQKIHNLLSEISTKTNFESNGNAALPDKIISDLSKLFFNKMENCVEKLVIQDKTLLINIEFLAVEFSKLFLRSNSPALMHFHAAFALLDIIYKKLNFKSKQSGMVHLVKYFFDSAIIFLYSNRDCNYNQFKQTYIKNIYSIVLKYDEILYYFYSYYTGIIGHYKKIKDFGNLWSCIEFLVDEKKFVEVMLTDKNMLTLVSILNAIVSKKVIGDSNNLREFMEYILYNTMSKDMVFHIFQLWYNLKNRYFILVPSKCNGILDHNIFNACNLLALKNSCGKTKKFIDFFHKNANISNISESFQKSIYNEILTDYCNESNDKTYSILAPTKSESLMFHLIFELQILISEYFSIMKKQEACGLNPMKATPRNNTISNCFITINGEKNIISNILKILQEVQSGGSLFFDDFISIYLPLNFIKDYICKYIEYLLKLATILVNTTLIEACQHFIFHDNIQNIITRDCLLEFVCHVKMLKNNWSLCNKLENMDLNEYKNIDTSGSGLKILYDILDGQSNQSNVDKLEEQRKAITFDSNRIFQQIFCILMSAGFAFEKYGTSIIIDMLNEAFEALCTFYITLSCESHSGTLSKVLSKIELINLSIFVASSIASLNLHMGHVGLSKFFIFLTLSATEFLCLPSKHIHQLLFYSYFCYITKSPQINAIYNNVNYLISSNLNNTRHTTKDCEKVESYEIFEAENLLIDNIEARDEDGLVDYLGEKSRCSTYVDKPQEININCELYDENDNILHLKCIEALKLASLDANMNKKINFRCNYTNITELLHLMLYPNICYEVSDINAVSTVSNCVYHLSSLYMSHKLCSIISKMTKIRENPSVVNIDKIEKEFVAMNIKAKPMKDLETPKKILPKNLPPIKRKRMTQKQFLSSISACTEKLDFKTSKITEKKRIKIRGATTYDYTCYKQTSKENNDIIYNFEPILEDLEAMVSQILACGHSSVIKRDFCRLFAAALYCKGELKRCIDYLLISLDIPASADIPPSESHSNSKIDTGDKSFPHSVDIYSLQRLLKDDHQIIGFIDLSSDNLHFKTEKNFYYIFYFKISKSNFEVKRFEDKRLLNINSNIIKIRSEISQSTKRLEKDQVQNYVYRLNESLDDNIRDFESILIENRIFISHTMDKSHEGFKNKILSDIDPIISQEVAPILSHIIANYHRMDGHILTKILSKYFSDCQLKEIRDYMKSKDLFSVSKLRSDHTHLFISSHLLYFPFESISTLRYQQCSRYISPNHFINCMKNKKFEIGDLYYLINPDGTLEKCQKRITDFLKNINTSIALKGHTGRLMDSDEINLNNELQKNQYFVYCGHGDGQRYLRKPVDFSHIKDITASMFLFGCSSLYCEPVSYFDAYGLVINLIRKNCPLLGGFLWHIFDRDSDLFTIKLLKSILEGDSKSVYDACLQAKSSDNYKCLNTASFVIYGYLF